MRRFLSILLLPLLLMAQTAFGAADDIARLYNFTAGTTIQSSQVNGEFNQLVTTMNTKFGRGIANTLTGNNTFSGDNTFSGINTFSHASSPIKSDFILEYTSAAGVTIDSVLHKDGAIRVPGSAGYAPTTNGDFGYDSTSNTYDVRVNGTNRYLLHDGNSTVFHPGFIAGNYYAPTWYSQNPSLTTTAGNGINSGTGTVAVPFYVPVTASFDRIHIRVTAAVGGATVHLGIYNNSGGKPSTRVLDAGTVSAAATGTVEATISQSLTQGWYWLTVRSSSASVAIAQPGASPNMDCWLLGANAGIGSNQPVLAWQDSSDTPATFTASPTAINDFSKIPYLFLRAS